MFIQKKNFDLNRYDNSNNNILSSSDDAIQKKNDPKNYFR